MYVTGYESRTARRSFESHCVVGGFHALFVRPEADVGGIVFADEPDLGSFGDSVFHAEAPVGCVHE